MRPRPLDGSADDGLSSSLLRFVDEGQLGPLRQALSDFNHRCRNLLNGMKMSFYLAKRSSPGPLSERWGELDQTYGAVEQLLERLSTIYRSMPLTLLKLRFGSLVDERSSVWASWFEQHGNTLTLEPPDREAVGELDAMRLISAIDAFITWRAESLPRGGRAFLKWATEGGCFQLSWIEQVPEHARNNRFPVEGVPDSRLPTATGALSLPLLARVISEHRGRLTWTREPNVEARMRWPLFASLSEVQIPNDARVGLAR
jgi:hypothetical protein